MFYLIFSFFCEHRETLKDQVIHAILKSSWTSSQVGLLRICILKRVAVYQFIVQAVLNFSCVVSLAEGKCV